MFHLKFILSLRSACFVPAQERRWKVRCFFGFTCYSQCSNGVEAKEAWWQEPLGVISITSCHWSWRYGVARPVLKHGPRSVTLMRAYKCQTYGRNESKRSDLRKKRMIDRSTLVYDLSSSIIVVTRKMVIYAWTGWSQGKLWWRLVAILTCKSFVWFGYRGERLIEPSSSWFLPKFPSG